MAELKLAPDPTKCVVCETIFDYRADKPVPRTCGAWQCWALDNWTDDDYRRHLRYVDARLEAGYQIVTVLDADGEEHLERGPLVLTRVDEEALRRAGRGTSLE